MTPQFRATMTALLKYIVLDISIFLQNAKFKFKITATLAVQKLSPNIACPLKLIITQYLLQSFVEKYLST